MPSVTAIVAAAGSGERLGAATPKAFVEVGGRPILVLAVERALASGVVHRVIVAAPPGDVERARELVPRGTEVVEGGPTRHASIAEALRGLDVVSVEAIVCHDAARPFATPELFAAVVERLDRFDGVVPAVPIVDTVKRVDGDRVVATEPRDGLVASQTPQAFRPDALTAAHDRAAAASLTFSDDAGCLEWAGFTVGVVAGDPTNLKITTPEDLRRAELMAGVPAGG